MTWSKADKDALAAAKADPRPRGISGVDAAGRAWRIYIIGRGEEAFYQEGDRALFFEVLVRANAIGRKSIRRWDNDEKVSEEERDRIVERATELLRKLGATEVKIG